MQTIAWQDNESRKIAPKCELETKTFDKREVVAKPSMVNRLKKGAEPATRVNRNRKNASNMASKLLQNQPYTSDKPDFTLSSNKTPFDLHMNTSFYQSNIECLSGGRNSLREDNVYLPKSSTIAQKKLQQASYQT